MRMNTASQQASQQNYEKSKPTCHHCKNQVTIEINAVNSNEKKTKPEITRIVPIRPTITMVVPKKSPTLTIRFRKITTRTLQIIKETEDLDLSSHPVRPVVELTTPQKKKVTLEQTQQTDRLPGIDDRKDKTKSKKKMLRWECPSSSPNFKLKTPRLHSGAACDRPETNEIPKLPRIPKVCLSATHGAHFKSN